MNKTTFRKIKAALASIDSALGDFKSLPTSDESHSRRELLRVAAMLEEICDREFLNMEN